MPATDDRHRITSLADLRARMGEAHPVTHQKVFDALDEQMSAFLQRSPFCLLATSDAEGNLEVSPKGDGAGFVLIEDPRSLVRARPQGQQAACTGCRTSWRTRTSR